MFSEEELVMIEDLVTYFMDFKAETTLEVRQAHSILEKIDKQLNG